MDAKYLEMFLYVGAPILLVVDRKGMSVLWTFGTP